MDGFEQLRKQAEARLSKEGCLGEEASSDSEYYGVTLYQTELEIQHEELQRAYSELNQLYEKYWSLYEFAPCGYVTLNPKGMITHINRQGIVLLGNISSPLQNFGFSRFIVPHHQSFFFTALQQAKQTRNKQSLELQLIPLDNQELLWVHLDIQATFDDKGEVIKYEITLTDVTTDKEADIAREKAKRLQLITDSVQGNIAYVDANQCYQFVNKTYKQWLGLTESEILGKTVVEVMGRDLYTKFYSLIEQVLQGETIKCEAKFPYQNRELRDVFIVLVPDLASTGKVEGYYALMTDITDSKQVTRQLQEQEAFLRSIYDGVEQAIFVVDVSEEGEFYWVDFNQVSERLMGMSRTEAIGESLEEVFSSELAPRVRERYEACLASEESYTYEECINLNGERTCWLLTLTPLKNEEGRIYRIIGTGVNIDNRKELEATLQEKAERERLVNTITYAVRQSLELHKVVETTITKLLEVFAVDEAVLAVYGKDEKEPPLVRVATEDTSYWSKEICNYSQAQLIFQEEEVVAINDLAATDTLCFRAKNAQSILLGGIYYNQQLQGVISLQYYNSNYDWSEAEKSLLKQVADQIAIALQQAQLYQRLNQELTERTQLQNQLHYEAYHDRLTGLPNRYLLVERLNEIIQSCHDDLEESELPFAVLFLDLNGFKHVNDTFGHEVGDQLLINVTLRLENCLREEDMIARFGGDEFVVLLERLPKKQGAIEVANRIQDVLKAPIVLNDIEVQVGTSIGIVYDEGRYSNSDPVLRDADIAMYQSKNQRVDYVIFDETDNVS